MGFSGLCLLISTNIGTTAQWALYVGSIWAIGYLDGALDADVREGYTDIQRLVIGTYSLRVAFLLLWLFVLLIGSDNLTSDILLFVVIVTIFAYHTFYI
jgi:hypothetical protein